MGPWLPCAIESAEAADPAPNPERRYDLAESATLAFLAALEALTPQQRAVLLMRDVFEFSVAETAAALALSEPNVKTSHHRARAAMEAYDLERVIPTAAIQQKHREVLERFLIALMTGDLSALSQLMAPGATAVADGAGRYAASKSPIVGAERVARLYLKLAQRPIPTEPELKMVNGLPALITRFPSPTGKNSPVVVVQIMLGADGKIARVYSLVVPEKVARLAAP